MSKKEIKTFDSTLKALGFIDDLKKDNIVGHLSNTAKQVAVIDAETKKKSMETIYSWQMTYATKKAEERKVVS